MKKLFILLLFLIGTQLYAQPDNKRVEIIEIGSRYIGSQGSEASIQSYNFKANLLRIKPKKEGKGFITMGLAYSHVRIDFKNEYSFISDIESFGSFSLNLNYIQPLNKKWSFVVISSPKMNSNYFTWGNSDAFYLNLIALANYSKTPNSRLSFGLMYTNTIGLPFPVPVATYWKRINNNWDFGIGFPRTYASYSFKETNKLTFLFEYEGYKANIDKNISHTEFIENRIAEEIRYSDFILGMEVQKLLGKFLFKVKSGYTISRNLKLLDKDRETAFEFDMNNNFSIGASVSFGINRKN